jgi:hypothetical protein
LGKIASRLGEADATTAPSFDPIEHFGDAGSFGQSGELASEVLLE